MMPGNELKSKSNKKGHLSYNEHTASVVLALSNRCYKDTNS